MGSSVGARGQSSIEHAASSEAWLRHTLEEILSQLRVLLDIDGCAFQTVDHERLHISPAASWFDRLELRTVMQPILDRPYDPARGGVTEAAVERGEPILISDMETWRGAGALRARLALTLDPVQADAAWGWYRTSSFISCPVRTAGGRTLGVLALSSSPPRPALNEEHLRVTEVFAGLAALALERSELLDREARRSRAEQLLHGAAQRMTASLDLDVVYRLIVEQAALVVAAPTALLTRLDDVTQTLRAVATVGATERISRHHYALGEGMLGAVARSGEAYVSRAEDRRHFIPWVAGEGVGSFVHVPIDLGPRRFGVLTVSHPEPDALGAPALELLQSLSRPAAAAIANALEFQHERRIAGALTRGFIPDAPSELEDFELGVVYEPVGHEVSGGDIFGVWRLRGGALAVLVGDVCGKGLEVAAVSAMVRFFVEARTWDSDCPAEVLQQTNEILRERLPGPVALVTAFLAVVDAGRLRYANAGHVPPLVVGADRRPRELPTTGLPLGVDADTRFEPRELQFGPDELLFASTDGLTEARRGGEQFGQARVSALVAEHAAALRPQALVEHAYAQALRWRPQLDDDVALIALRPRAMSAIELRDEPVGADASRALFAEYLELVGERLPDFTASERVFGSDDVFAAAGGAWLVVYEDGRPVACAGLRTLAPGVAEIKRMFVTARARGRGHARRLLRELERRAAEHGHRSVRLLTTDVLREAIALYEADGYRVAGRIEHARGPVEIWLEKPLGSGHLLVDDEVRRRAETEHRGG